MARLVFIVFVGLILAAGPVLGALASVQAANPHAAMTMSQSSGDDGCCDQSTPDDTGACAAHCAAGIIVAGMRFAPSEAVSTFVTPDSVLPSASHAPVPDTAPPKSAAA